MQTHPPLCKSFQIVAVVDIPWVELKDPPRNERWMCLMEIVQHMWRIGEIPQELG